MCWATRYWSTSGLTLRAIPQMTLPVMPRFVPPRPAPLGQSPCYAPAETPIPDAVLLPWEHRSALEVYAGRAGLSIQLAATGLLVDTPLEAYPAKNQYVEWCDVKQPRTRFRLIQKLKSRSLRYVHFGITCTTWGNAGRLDGGTRRRGLPYGDGSLSRENDANAELRMVADLCTIAALHG